jgi:DNA-binding GntR family transcriptional regulator
MDLHALPEKDTSVRSADPEITYLDHVAILDAIAAGDAERAESLARAHVRRAREAIERSFAENGGADIESIL